MCVHLQKITQNNLILRYKISNVVSIFNYFFVKGLPYLKLRSSISY